MSLTLEQRRDINRRNASRSTGPRTQAGKDNSRKNAMKHGLRAKILALPNEDPAQIAERAEFWNDYYKPQSPAALHLVNECVQATILSDRVHQYHHFALSRQIRGAGKACERAREYEVKGLNLLMNDDPRDAVRLLKHSGYGIRSLMMRWELLRVRFEADSCLTGSECDEAIGLLGCRSTLEDMRENPGAYMLCLFNALANNAPSADGIRALCDPKNVPPSLRPKICGMPSRPPEDCRTWIKLLFTKELGMLSKLAASFEEDERLDLIEAEDRAVILQEETAARLYLRYHAESRNTFHRAFNKLEKTLKSDAAGVEDGAPNEADAEAETTFEAEAANEPEARESSELGTETESPNEADLDASALDLDAGILGKVKPMVMGCLLILLLFSARFANAARSPNEADSGREAHFTLVPTAGGCEVLDRPSTRLDRRGSPDRVALRTPDPEHDGVKSPSPIGAVETLEVGIPLSRGYSGFPRFEPRCVGHGVSSSHG